MVLIPQQAALVPILKYGNMYRSTPGLSRLFKDPNLQAECVSFVALSGVPSIRSILQIYCSLLQGSTLKSICVRYAPQAKFIDERRLITFGLLHKMIRCLSKYPIYMGPREKLRPDSLRYLFTGALCVDRLCCITKLGLMQLEHTIENDPDVSIVWK